MDDFNRRLIRLHRQSLAIERYWRNAGLGSLLYTDTYWTNYLEANKN